MIINIPSEDDWYFESITLSDMTLEFNSNAYKSAPEDGSDESQIEFVDCIW